MGSIVRMLDMGERIDQECYFCGEKRSVKYIIIGAIADDGSILDKEVACCNRCIPSHIWANDME